MNEDLMIAAYKRILDGVDYSEKEAVKKPKESFPRSKGWGKKVFRSERSRERLIPLPL